MRQVVHAAIRGRFVPEQRTAGQAAATTTDVLRRRVLHNAVSSRRAFINLAVRQSAAEHETVAVRDA